MGNWLTYNLHHAGPFTGESLHDDMTLETSAEIRVKEDLSDRLKRFLVAHGLAHLVLHDPNRSYTETFGKPITDLGEIQADNFALGLLLPSWGVHAVAPYCRQVSDLAEFFEVTQKAMAARLRYLGYRIAGD